jgi:hypothetical protein
LKKYKDARELSLDALVSAAKQSESKSLDKKFLVEVLDSAWKNQSEESPRTLAISEVQSLIEGQAKHRSSGEEG